MTPVYPTRKAEIVAVAARLFLEKGYTAVSMRDIAAQLDIKAASLYNHISSKQDILDDIIIRLAETFTQRLDGIIADGGTATEQLSQLIRLHLEISSRDIPGMAVLNHDWMHLEGSRSYYLELRASYEDNIRQILLRGIQEGDIAAIDVEVALFSLLSTLRSLYIWLPQKAAFNQQQLGDELCRVLLRGMT